MAGDRIQMILLVACAGLGAALAAGDAGSTVDPSVGSAMHATPSATPAASLSPDPGPSELPAVAAGPPGPRGDDRSSAAEDATPNGDDPDAAAVARILDRFAMRHTALSAREREALARTIVREARAHDLEPDLVMAVIEVESAGYPLAVSHVGALGLMQLMPATGEELAGKLGIEWMGPDTLFDPKVNVRLGTAYLRELSDRYRGDVNLALAAYNWGPGRIDRRLRRGATVPSLYIEQVRSARLRYAAVSTARS